MLAQPKEKKERALGVHLFVKGERCLSPKCAAVRNPKRPGIHGGKPRSLTEYGRQFVEKQKLKVIYGIKEQQLLNYFTRALKSKTSTDTELIKLLEKRIDNVIYRAGFTVSRSVARHLVSHSHFLINGRRVDIPSYRVAINDVIEIKPSSKALKLFEGLREQLKRFQAPQWLKIDPENLSIKIVQEPTAELEEQPFNVKLVVEFLNR